MCEKNEGYSAFKQACIQSYKEKYENFEVPEDDVEYSKRHRRQINRIPREILGTTEPVYPEVDNAFERARSRFIYCRNKRKNLKDGFT